MRIRFVISVLAALLLGVQPLAGCAQEAGEQTAEAALQRGDYANARQLFHARLDAPDSTGQSIIGYAETFLATGAYDEGLRDVEARLRTAPDNPYWLHARGRLLAAIGRYDEAAAAFNQSGQQQPEYWRTALELASLLDLTGRTREAQRIYAALFERYKAGRFRTAENLAIAGRAAAALGEFHEANAAFRTAYQMDAEHVPTLYWWAELFRTKYNDADAGRTYEEALAVNPRHADVFVGLARSAQSFGQKEELARQALATNPNHTAALSVLAGLRILDGQYDEAEAMLNQALAVNPAAIEALAHQAAIHRLLGDTAAFAQVEQRALAVNPRSGDFYVTMAEDLALRFRYPDAVEVARKGVQVAPQDPTAQAALGTALLRLGASGEARQHLERSFRDDPFNLFVGNTLTLLDEYENFTLLEGPHIRLIIHNDERDVLGPAMLAEAEAAYTALSERYPYTPAGKLLVEAYNDRDDFAVRVAGVPHLGLLGVSFGDVVALNTPQAQAGNAYNWARTLWHELAHTMAIGVSDFHVPRWFTEGLSVYEEQQAHPAWGRDMDLELFSAFDQDKLLPLAEIDKGFTRPAFPGQVLLSYYHASKVVSYIVEQHGFDAVTGILAALREGHPIDAAIQQVTGQSTAALDAAFRADLRRQRDQFDQVLAGMPDLLEGEEEETPSLLDKLTGRTDNPFLQRLQEGQEALRREEYDTAETRYRQALDLYSAYTGPGNPYTGLAAVYRARDERARLIETLQQFLEVSEYGAAEARELGTLYEGAGNAEQAILYLERSLTVEPYDLPTHEQLAALYEQQERHEDAVRARRAVLALDPVDTATAYYELARALHRSGQAKQARRAVLQALELAPSYREAQKLLLVMVDGEGR